MQKTVINISPLLKFTCAIMLCAAVLTPGCQKTQLTQTAHSITPATNQTELLREIEQLKKENESLKQQNETLSKLPPDSRADAIYKLQKVEIGKFTGIYKEDHNTEKSKESLVVYVQPFDDTGDSIKAAGRLEIQLWDLNNPQNQALLESWKVEPAELKKLWVNSVALTGYRFRYNLPASVMPGRMLTVKVTFTDYLSGKIFTQQKTIKR